MVPLTPRRRPSPLARLGLAAFWIVLAVGPAGAATFTVTKTADTDDGVCDATDCSLREAITAANNDVATSNVIDFASSLPASSTITLLTPLPLNISQQLLIDGTTATNLTVRGDATRSLFDVAADTTIADVILQNGQLAIFDDIRLKFDVGEDQTLSEVIADADAPPLTGGQVEKLGAATLILLGANTYSGGTTVTAGTLQGNADSLQGTITLAADTLLVFDQGVDDAFTGTVTGAGRVEKIGALQTGCVEAVDGAKCFGILTVNGPLTHTGGTTVTTGVLRIDPDDMPG
ncbi:MAG: CSLREA domain-containing protein, partial [Myxococcales bacterium]|nr:CSLREA domain-containing protein [Myxococcales bacterium]